ncbi:hypothetical protein TNCV_4297211 [Trichonephila clavipes]|nr:hypothetical protein TNCV_4297211 [Trichonephila clavipes]
MPQCPIVSHRVFVLEGVQQEKRSRAGVGNLWLFGCEAAALSSHTQVSAHQIENKIPAPNFYGRAQKNTRLPSWKWADSSEMQKATRGLISFINISLIVMTKRPKISSQVPNF